MRKRSHAALVALFFGLTLIASVPVFGAEAANTSGTPHISLGEALPLWSCIPFAGMLLSIALMPLALPSFWHHHYGKVSVFWAAAMSLPFLIVYKELALDAMLHILLADYVPFIILLWSLYTVSGGILLRGTATRDPGGELADAGVRRGTGILDGDHRGVHAAHPALSESQQLP